jgi:uncharacterized protein (DUF1800 family)
VARVRVAEARPAEIKKLAVAFRANYEIRPLMRSMLLSAQFRDPANRGGLIKSPVELIVGTVHLLGLPVPEKTQLVRMMQGLGQMPFDPPNVKGWAGGETWITPTRSCCASSSCAASSRRRPWPRWKGR